jgi:hypothetical protein
MRWSLPLDPVVGILVDQGQERPSEKRVRFVREFACVSERNAILSQMEQGDPQVPEQLLPLVYSA